jgi:hypothetical protein
VQCFGSLLDLNCHAHALLPDGVFAAGSGTWHMAHGTWHTALCLTAIPPIERVGG